ncbi:MAG: hypothetical protein LAO09_19905 [Acidobacteriia bacterium]|nr:hypothetical protein [Terriglobia bacterium]
MANTAKSSPKLKVLYGESDPETLAAQAVSIQKAGHQLETAVGRKGMEEALRQGSFDLVILGPTLTKNDRHHLPYMVKKTNSGTRVLQDRKALACVRPVLVPMAQEKASVAALVARVTQGSEPAAEGLQKLLAVA